MDHGGPDQQRVLSSGTLSPTTAKAHKWSATQDHQPLPSTHRLDYPWRPACEMQPLAGHPIPAQTIFTSPIRHAGDILLFAIPLRSCQGAAPQHRSLRLLPRMRWQQPCPQTGERGAPTPFFLRQSCSGPSWRSPRRPRQASEVIVLLTQLPSSLYFAGPPNQNRAGVKFSRETHLGSRFIFFGATGPVWREHGGFFDDFYFSFSSLFDRTVSVEFGSFAFLDTLASMSGRDGWERRYQDRDGQNWNTRSLFFCNGFLVLPGTAKEEEGFRPVTYCIATNVSHRRMMVVGR